MKILIFLSSVRILNSPFHNERGGGGGGGALMVKNQ
jgi:hypothetical protein